MTLSHWLKTTPTVNAESAEGNGGRGGEHLSVHLMTAKWSSPRSSSVNPKKLTVYDQTLTAFMIMCVCQSDVSENGLISFNFLSLNSHCPPVVVVQLLKMSSWWRASDPTGRTVISVSCTGSNVMWSTAVLLYACVPGLIYGLACGKFVVLQLCK